MQRRVWRAGPRRELRNVERAPIKMVSHRPHSPIWRTALKDNAFFSQGTPKSSRYGNLGSKIFRYSAVDHARIERYKNPCTPGHPRFLKSEKQQKVRSSKARTNHHQQAHTHRERGGGEKKKIFTLKVGASSPCTPPDREPPLPLTSLGNPPGPTEEEEEDEEVDLSCAFLAETAPNDDRALLLLMLLLPAPPREELGAPGDRNGDHALDPPPYSRIERGGREKGKDGGAAPLRFVRA